MKQIRKISLLCIERMRWYFIIFLFLLFSCEPGGPGNSDKKGSALESPDPIDSYKKIELEDFYTLEVPEAFKESTILHEEAATQYLSVKYQFGMIILNEEIHQARNAMNILNVELEESNLDTQFIDHYMQFQLNNLKTIARNYDYPVITNLKIDGMTARTFEITLDNEMDATRRVFCGNAFESENQVYYIYLFYPAENQEEFRPIKDHILESFRLKEKNTAIASDSSGVIQLNTPKKSGSHPKK